FDVAAFPDADQFRADPQRIADVLQSVRADHEVELPIGKRPRLAGTDVALHPGVGREPLLIPTLRWRPSERAVITSRVERLGIQHPLSAIKGAGPAADIENDVSGR